jgi:hypothetical protein
MDMLEEIIQLIDQATDPAHCSLQQALVFLEQVSTEVDSRIDGIKDYLRALEERDAIERLRIHEGDEK